MTIEDYKQLEWILMELRRLTKEQRRVIGILLLSE